MEECVPVSPTAVVSAADRGTPVPLTQLSGRKFDHSCSHSAFSTAAPHVFTTTNTGGKLWHRHSGLEVADWPLGEPCQQVVEHPRLDSWVVASSGAETCIRLTRDLREHSRLPHPDEVCTCAVLPSDDIITGCDDGRIRRFTGAECVMDWNLTGRVKCVRGFEDGARVAFAKWGGAGILHLDSGMPVHTWTHDSHCVAVSPSENLFAVGLYSQYVYTYDLRQPNDPLSKINTRSFVMSLQLLSDEYLLTADTSGNCAVRSVVDLAHCVAETKVGGAGQGSVTAVNGGGAAIMTSQSAGCTLVDVSMWAPTEVRKAVGDALSTADGDVAAVSAQVDAVTEDDEEARLPPGFD
eukprot:NODE_1980_length_1168_cov_28.528338_g1963_i0.p1 GENE.NODE_1980_length_1168_cov_28.528338_g1963_i0~~NODE_1980_length_1168_cov_28.528338_g1963_i0.p1  ORF type:complete len:351 (+),score=35.91 NODE_1980_length_1168_cov_28.528338_g1963_i0:70-1122(+)